MIGVNLRGVDIVQPIPKAIRPQLRANPQDPRSERALELVNEGWSIKDVLAHGVINYHPVVVGTAEDVADFMEHWFLAGATDGFSLAPDSQMGVTEFVEQVVPILQARAFTITIMKATPCETILVCLTNTVLTIIKKINH